MQQTNERRSPNGADVTMGEHRSIFRPQARRQNQQAPITVEMPKLASPRAFNMLWMLALLLMVAGCLVAFWPVIFPFLP